ncbi:MAG TPA: ATP-binding protein [Longimicrobium sp.]|jgi:hypothetical protein
MSASPKQYKFTIGNEYVGASLLDIVSGALYGQVLDVVREYIQNAFDAKSRRVHIVLRDDEIWIRDDGIGLNPTRLDQARMVAVSAKKPGDVGFRGIGVYSSYNVADSLELITRPQGGSSVYVLRIDFAGMRAERERREADPSLGVLSLVDALEQFTVIEDFVGSAPLDDKKAFSLVRLTNPADHLREALADESGLTSYLQAAIPLSFPKGHRHAKQIQKQLVAKGIELRRIQVALTPATANPRDAKAAVNFFADGYEDLLPPTFRELRRNGKRLAVLWYCVHRKPTVLPKGVPAGFQTRLNGFGIGDPSLPRRFWGKAGAGILYRHLIGEIHAVDPRLRPSAERSQFEDSPARREFEAELTQALDKVEDWIQKRQTALNDLEDKEDAKGPAVHTAAEVTLKKLCKTYGAKPPLTYDLIVDPKTKKKVDERAVANSNGSQTPSDSAQTPNPGEANSNDGSQPNTPQASGTENTGVTADSADAADTAKDSGGDQGQSSSQPAAAPSISKQLWDQKHPKKWPSGAWEKFQLVDRAVDESTDAKGAQQIRNKLRDLLH